MDAWRARSIAGFVSFAVAAAAGCVPEADGTPEAAETADAAQTPVIEAAMHDDVAAALDEGLERITAFADSVDSVMHPLPLLSPAEESTLRRYVNAQQLARARELGARPSDAAELERFEQEGRLVRLEQSNALWIVRDLEQSQPLVTPDAVALLTEVAERFQSRLAEMGIPPYRLEVTSALRTPENQTALRGSNPNAASGTSAHEFGTTFDVAYDGYAAPLDSDLDLHLEAAPWLASRLESIAASTLERVSGRRSRELKRILSHVLMDIQSEGKVMVMLEQLQPVFHMTVATRDAS